MDLDAPVVAPQSAPGAFVEEDAGLGSGADSVDKIVLYESEVAVDDLLDGFQEPAPAPPCRNELLSAAVPPGNTTPTDRLQPPPRHPPANATDGGGSAAGCVFFFSFAFFFGI